jgi:AcrR family transcriptional regulator
MSRPADPNARIALLRAAEAVFAEKGVAPAKVEEIAKRASLSMGAFYLHFQSKEDAVKAIVEAFLVRCEAVVSIPCQEDEIPSDPTEMLAFCRERDAEVFEFFWQNRAVLAILGSCQGAHTYLVEAFRADVEKRTAGWIDTLKGHEMFRADLDSEFVSTVLCGAYHELVHRLVASPKKPPIREWVAKVQSVFIRGLGTPEVAAACAASSEAPLQNAPVTHVGRARRSRGKHESV